METAMVPGIYDPTLADANVEAETEDAQEMVRRLAREEGLFVGRVPGPMCLPRCDWRKRSSPVPSWSLFFAMAVKDILINDRTIRTNQSEIRAHGERDYPHECCGLLLAAFAEMARRFAGNLSHFKRARRRGETKPLPYPSGRTDARREIRSSKRLEVVGFYHSHPDHPAVPSGYDLEHAWPVYSYVVVAVKSGRPKICGHGRCKPTVHDLTRKNSSKKV